MKKLLVLSLALLILLPTMAFAAPKEEGSNSGVGYQFRQRLMVSQGENKLLKQGEGNCEDCENCTMDEALQIRQQDRLRDDAECTNLQPQDGTGRRGSAGRQHRDSCVLD